MGRHCRKPKLVFHFVVSLVCGYTTSGSKGGSVGFARTPFTALKLFYFLWILILFDPRHDKTNNVAVRPAKTQIRLSIRPVWSESSLGAHVSMFGLSRGGSFVKGRHQTVQKEPLFEILPLVLCRPTVSGRQFKQNSLRYHNFFFFFFDVTKYFLIWQIIFWYHKIEFMI